MANAITTGKIYIDSTGEITTQTTKVAYIIFTPNAANDQLILRETASGANCINIRGATAQQTIIFDFSNSPIMFQNGIYVQTLNTSATATLITTKSGG